MYYTKVTYSLMLIWFSRDDTRYAKISDGRKSCGILVILPCFFLGFSYGTIRSFSAYLTKTVHSALAWQWRWARLLVLRHCSSSSESVIQLKGKMWKMPAWLPESLRVPILQILRFTWYSTIQWKIIVKQRGKLPALELRQAVPSCQELPVLGTSRESAGEILRSLVMGMPFTTWKQYFLFQQMLLKQTS